MNVFNVKKIFFDNLQDVDGDDDDDDDDDGDDNNHGSDDDNDDNNNHDNHDNDDDDAKRKSNQMISAENFFPRSLELNDSSSSFLLLKLAKDFPA